MVECPRDTDAWRPQAGGEVAEEVEGLIRLTFIGWADEDPGLQAGEKF